MFQIIKNVTYIPVYVIIICRIDSYKTEMQVIVVFVLLYIYSIYHSIYLYIYVHNFLNVSSSFFFFGCSVCFD